MQEKKEEDLQQVLNKVFEVGIDEVGRGAVFGPVFSAVVVLTEKNKFILRQYGVMDSKKLTPKKRKLLLPKILSLSSDYGIGQSSTREIDKFGIRVATEEQINLKRKEEIDKTIKNFNKIKTQINSFSGYKDSDELTKSRIKEIFEKNIKKIKDTNIIHSIKAINDYFEDQTLPNILEELDNSDNNKIISSSSIKFENKKFLLESETDVIEYIDSYKNAILNEIKLGNKIKI